MKWIHLVSVFIGMPTALFAMADRTPPVYGIPTLYGEYELSPDDLRRARSMYGDVPRARPVAVPVKSDAAVKLPVKSKKIASKKSSKKKHVRAAAKKDAVVKKETEHATVKDVAADVVAADGVDQAPLQPVMDTVADMPRPAPKPIPAASDIAGAVSNRMDVDSYCTTQTDNPGKNMPDGFILMPGRPDLMSCRGKK